jgi:hypothetical protein
VSALCILHWATVQKKSKRKTPPMLPNSDPRSSEHVQEPEFKNHCNVAPKRRKDRTHPPTLQNARRAMHSSSFALPTLYAEKGLASFKFASRPPKQSHSGGQFLGVATSLSKSCLMPPTSCFGFLPETRRLEAGVSASCILPWATTRNQEVRSWSERFMCFALDKKRTLRECVGDDFLGDIA